MRFCQFPANLKALSGDRMENLEVERSNVRRRCSGGNTGESCCRGQHLLRCSMPLVTVVLRAQAEVLSTLEGNLVGILKAECIQAIE